jgi:Serine/threonine protein kinase
MLAAVDTKFVRRGLPSYTVAGELDRGGYGITFDASIGGQRVAVKILDTLWHEAAIRTPREIAALRALAHPNIVRIVDDGFLKVPGSPDRYRFIACEFIEGLNLAKLHDGGHLFSVVEVLAIGRQVASALGAMHDSRFIHRDVKPNNVMFDIATGKAVLLDVGIAKHLGVTPVTLGSVPGTYGWKSPEHIKSEPQDRRSDLYQLGLVLYWAATGAHPFEGRAVALGGDVEAAMLAGTFDPVVGLQPGLPADAAAVIDRSLSLKPYLRPRRASEVEIVLR